MTRPVVTAQADTPVGGVRKLLKQAGIRHLPVLDGDLLVGIVSDRDLRQAPSEVVPVGQIMTRPVFVLSHDTSIRSAARVFRERRIGAMPVLDGRKLVGIVSVVDVLRVLEEEEPRPGRALL